MSVAHDAVDPFGTSPDPEAYVPRQASEEALAALLAYLRVGATQIVLQGPPGIGKTLLLRVIASRLEGHLRVVHVPYPVLPADEICAWILGLMGEDSGDDERALVALARRLRENGTGLAILIDDAGSMPLPTVRRMSRIASEARPAMRLVFALPDDDRGDEVLAALGSGVEAIRFDEAMSLPETAAYVEARLSRARVPDRIRAGFDMEMLRAIHEDSEGIPQLVNALAAEWLVRISARVADASRGGAIAPAGATAGESRLGSALLGPSGPAVADPWLERADAAGTPPRSSVETTPALATPEAIERAEAETAYLEAVPDEEGAVAAAPPRPRESARHDARDFVRSASPELEAPAEPLASRARERRPARSSRRRLWLAFALACVFGLGLLAGRISPLLWSFVPIGADSSVVSTPVEPPPVAVAPPPGPPVAEAPAPVEAEPAPSETAPAPDRNPEPEGKPVAVAPEEPPAPEPAAAPEHAGPRDGETQVAALAEPTREREPDSAPAPAAKPEPPAPVSASAETVAPRQGADEPDAASDGATDEAGEAQVASVPEHVLVSVNATPWARIEIDSKEVGITPLADLPVIPGEHEFRAELPDGRVLVRKVPISNFNRRVVFP